MGCFTWTLANKKRRETEWGYAPSCKLGYDCAGYIALPQGFEHLYDDVQIASNGRGFISEAWYDGYGMFGEHDAYDVVVDVNKGYLVDTLEKIKIKEFDRCKTQEQINNTAEKYDKYIEIAKMFEVNKPENEIVDCFKKTLENPQCYSLAKEWKRNLGILLSCYLEDNMLLKYPLKIVNSTNVIYENLEPSDSTQ